MTSSFQSLLSEAVRRSGQNKSAFARAIGVSPSVLSRLLHEDGQSPDCVLCLRVARISGISPFTVLHAADQSDVADLLRALFAELPSASTWTLTVDEQRLVRHLRALRPADRRIVRTIAHALTIAHAPPEPPP